MANVFKYAVLFLALFSISACNRAEKEYNRLMSSSDRNSTEIRSYLEKYPKSPYANELRDTFASNIIETYSQEDIQNREYFWCDNDEIHYTVCKLLNSEEYIWQLAIKKDQLEYYELYLDKFSNGPHCRQIELLLIDKEIDATFSGEHGTMPPLEKGASTGTSYSSISLNNDTKYELIISYKGPSSKRVIIPPHGETKIELENGHYKVSARVRDQGVKPYAGEENLDGSYYNSTYYIESRGSRFFNPYASSSSHTKFNPNIGL